jgi:hypothetical protein
MAAGIIIIINIMIIINLNDHHQNHDHYDHHKMSSTLSPLFHGRMRIQRKRRCSGVLRLLQGVRPSRLAVVRIILKENCS